MTIFFIAGTVYLARHGRGTEGRVRSSLFLFVCDAQLSTFQGRVWKHLFRNEDDYPDSNSQV